MKGTIHNSTDKSYIDGETFVFRNYRYINTYPAGKDGEAYFLMRTNVGLYFKMLKSEHDDEPLA